MKNFLSSYFRRSAQTSSRTKKAASMSKPQENKLLSWLLPVLSLLALTKGIFLSEEPLPATFKAAKRKKRKSLSVESLGIAHKNQRKQKSLKATGGKVQEKRLCPQTDLKVHISPQTAKKIAATTAGTLPAQSSHSSNTKSLHPPLKKVVISSHFGYRIHPISKQRKLHKGIDLAAPKGTPVAAAQTGKIIRAHYSPSFGHCVQIRHADGHETTYAHLSRYGKHVKKGMHVTRGQTIGFVGNSGRSAGAHLHFELAKDGQPVDPKPFIT